MKKEEIFKKLVSDVKSLLKENLISLYVVGTAATSERFKDIDLFAIVKKPLAENEESAEIEKLTKKYYVRIGLRTIAYNELLGKIKGASLITKIKIIPLGILIKLLKSGKKVYGNIDLSKLPIKPLSPKKEAKFELEKLNSYLKIIKEGKKLPFPEAELPKFVAYLTRAELQLNGKPFEMSYEKMSEMLKDKPGHIIHEIVKIRKGKKMINKEFINKIEIYVKEIERRIK